MKRIQLPLHERSYMEPKNNKYYQAGAELAKKCIESGIYWLKYDSTDYKKLFGKEPIGGSFEWIEFLDGGRDYLRDFKYMKFKDEILAFDKDLNELLDKYPNISIHIGCGECEGITIHRDGIRGTIYWPLSDNWKEHLE